MELKSKHKGISGSTLKIIAMITMLIDHFAAGPLAEMIVNDARNFSGAKVKVTGIVVLYYVMRTIGRVAFPIFIFLLVEGYGHTRNRWIYLARLFVLAFISEVPYDTCMWLDHYAIKTGKFFEFSHQNVFFTLVIGLLTIIVIDVMWHTHFEMPMRISFAVVVVAAGFAGAELLHTDYGGWGVLAIAAAYVAHRMPKIVCMAAPAAVLTIMQFAEGQIPSEAFSFVDLALVSFYNGERGLKLKYVFYAVYPVHLFMFAIIKYFCM